MRVDVRMGAGLSRLTGSPLVSLDLPDGATVEDLYGRLASDRPDLAGALRSALPIVAGEHVARERALEDREVVSLLLPVSGG